MFNLAHYGNRNEAENEFYASLSILGKKQSEFLVPMAYRPVSCTMLTAPIYHPGGTYARIYKKLFLAIPSNFRISKLFSSFLSCISNDLDLSDSSHARKIMDAISAVETLESLRLDNIAATPNVFHNIVKSNNNLRNVGIGRCR